MGQFGRPNASRPSEAAIYWRYARRNQLYRQELFFAQDGICAICGKLMTRERCTLDHVVARGLGGTDAFGNLVVTCWQCNNDKGDAPPTGCELIFLLAVNNRLGVEPMRW